MATNNKDSIPVTRDSPTWESLETDLTSIFGVGLSSEKVLTTVEALGEKERDQILVRIRALWTSSAVLPRRLIFPVAAVVLPRNAVARKSGKVYADSTLLTGLKGELGARSTTRSGRGTRPPADDVATSASVAALFSKLGTSTLGDDEKSDSDYYSGTEGGLADEAEAVHSPFREEDGDVLEAADHVYDADKARCHETLSLINQLRDLAGVAPLGGGPIDSIASEEEIAEVQAELDKAALVSQELVLLMLNKAIASYNSRKGGRASLAEVSELPGSLEEIKALFAATRVPSREKEPLPGGSVRRSLFTEVRAAPKVIGIKAGGTSGPKDAGLRALFSGLAKTNKEFRGGSQTVDVLDHDDDDEDDCLEDEADDDSGARAVKYLARALLRPSTAEGTANPSRRAKKLAKISLSHPLGTKPVRTVKFGAGNPSELLGLQFIEYVTQSGERSCVSWFKTDLLPEVPETKENTRSLGDLKYHCFVIDLMLRDEHIVASTRSGSSCVLDVVARKCLLLNGIVTGTMQWQEGEKLLPIGALKSSTIDPAITKRLTKLLKPDSRSGSSGGKGKDG
jgi:hypothetical protein